ncbi:MAG: hypothetical protein ACREH9_04525 [Pseudomonadota bacterium]
MNELNGRMRVAAESTLGIIVARFVIPGLIFIMGTLGSVVLYGLADRISALDDSTRETAAKAIEVHEEISVLASKFDASQTIRRDEIATLRATLLDHEGRIRALERKEQP